MAVLKKNKLLKISENSCRDFQSKIGQLMYSTVYYKNNTENNVENEKYLKMIQELNIGGVLPHFNLSLSGNDKEKYIKQIYDYNSKIKQSSNIVPFLGVDYLFSCGLGYGFGALPQAPLKCKNDYYKLQATCHAMYGINQALGPTIEHNEKNPISLIHNDFMNEASALIDEFNKVGVATTLKHFPYTPKDYNLHSQSRDSKLGLDVVEGKIKNFHDLSVKSDFAMSTHLYNSNIDPLDMATFSKKWTNILRKNVNFGGILMADALFMISRYKENMVAMSLNFDQKGFSKKLDDESVFAIRALLAGNDMIFIDGNYLKSYNTFNDLLYVACSDSKYSNDLRNRINKSFDKISNYKNANITVLAQMPKFDSAFLYRANSILSHIPLYQVSAMDDKYCAEISSALEMIKDIKFTPLKKYNFEVTESSKECLECINLEPSGVDSLSIQYMKKIEKVMDTIPEVQHP